MKETYPGPETRGKRLKRARKQTHFGSETRAKSAPDQLNTKPTKPWAQNLANLSLSKLKGIKIWPIPSSPWNLHPGITQALCKPSACLVGIYSSPPWPRQPLSWTPFQINLLKEFWVKIFHWCRAESLLGSSLRKPEQKKQLTPLLKQWLLARAGADYYILQGREKQK